MQDIQVRIYSVQISRNDGETETQFHPTRIEAEAAANQILARSDGSTVKEIKIFSVPQVIPNSPKRAWLEGVEVGRNTVDKKITGLRSAMMAIGAWSLETGWLFRDERAASRKPDTTAPEEC